MKSTSTNRINAGAAGRRQDPAAAGAAGAAGRRPQQEDAARVRPPRRAARAQGGRVGLRAFRGEEGERQGVPCMLGPIC